MTDSWSLSFKNDFSWWGKIVISKPKIYENNNVRICVKTVKENGLEKHSKEDGKWCDIWYIGEIDKKYDKCKYTLNWIVVTVMVVGYIN